MQVHLLPTSQFDGLPAAARHLESCVFFCYRRWVGKVSLLLLSFHLSADLNAFE
jgi:hypothetical protein